MLDSIVCLSWFDAITIASTFLTILLVRLLNKSVSNNSVSLSEGTSKASTAVTPNSPSTSTHAVPQAAATGAGADSEIAPADERSENNETSPRVSTYQPSNSSPNLTANRSLSASINNSTPSFRLSTDIYSDECNEEEDTLSLDNFFPCDQSEIYASSKISFIIDELLQTEINYVANLRRGMQNYGQLGERPDLPKELRSSKSRRQLIGNIEEVLDLHERQVLPLMRRNQRDLRSLFDDFSALIDKNQFYSYVIFMMNKKTSMQLRQEQREWLQTLQTDLKDKLGIDSFLVQPVQRLTRYPLLLQQFISEFYRSGISCKPVLVSVCKLETRMRRLLEVVNQAEELPNIDDMDEQLNVMDFGDFHKSAEFDAYHYRSRKKYRVKVFLFESCLLCAEVRKRRLVYRQHYDWEVIELQPNGSKAVKLLLKPAPDADVFKEEFEFSAAEAISVTRWLRCTQKIIENSRQAAAQRGKLTLPTEVVLALFFAIWFMWQCF